MKNSSRILTSLLCGCLAYAMLSADEMITPIIPNTALSNSSNPPTAPVPGVAPATQRPPKEEAISPLAISMEGPPVAVAYPHRLQMKQTSGKGIGYKHGYSTLELFFSPWFCFDKYFPFIDLKAHRFSVGKYAANAGMGLRGYSPNRKSFWGVNAYYDYKQTHHQNYKQASLGLEFLNLHWDFRINGYYPFGVKHKHEFAMLGVDTEMSYHWNPGKNLEVTTALGSYYFHENDSRYALGGKARAKIELWNFLSFEGNVSYDNLFKWMGQGQVSLTIPLGSKKVGPAITKSDCPHAFALGKRQAQPVERQEIIVTHRHRSRTLSLNSTN